MEVHLLKVSRLEGLFDGVFAIAMTILALDLHLPPGPTTQLLTNVILITLLPKLFIYIGSFIILGTLWIAMNFQTGLIERVNRPYLWTNVLYLMVVCVVPFSASLLATFRYSKLSIWFYAINLLCASLCQFLVFQCAHIFHLNKDLCTQKIRYAVIKRIFVAPVFYVSSLFIAHWNTTLAFGMLIIPTVIYMIPGQIDKYADA